MKNSSSGNRREGPKRYWVTDPENTASAPFSIILGHSRERYALQALIQFGATGCSFLDSPAPRWSGYVHKLRRKGLMIDTLSEPHGGEFPGHHARYVLRSRVESDPEPISAHQERPTHACVTSQSEADQDTSIASESDHDSHATRPDSSFASGDAQ